jgi:hypothetical protein
LSGPWSTTLPTQSIGVSNFDFANLTGYTSYSEIANGVSFGPPIHFASTDGTATTSHAVHLGYPASVQNEANQSIARGSGIAVSAAATRSAPSPDGGVASFDMSTLLPLLDAVTLDSSWPSQPAVSWVTEAGSLAAASGTIVTVAWSAPLDGGASVQGTWTIVAPPSATQVRAQSSPADGGEPALRERIAKLQGRGGDVDRGPATGARPAASLRLLPRRVASPRRGRKETLGRRGRASPAAHAAVGGSTSTPAVVGSVPRLAADRGSLQAR